MEDDNIENIIIFFIIGLIFGVVVGVYLHISFGNYDPYYLKGAAQETCYPAKVINTFKIKNQNFATCSNKTIEEIYSQTERN